MKSKALTVVFLLALANASFGQTATPSQNAPAEPVKMAAPEKTGDVALAADRQPPSSLDPRVCLEFSTSAQVIACAEKYRPRKRPA